MKVFTVGEVAKICKVAPRIVSKWFDSGRLKGYRIPGSQDRRIPREYLIKFLKEHGMPIVESDIPGGEPIDAPVATSVVTTAPPAPSAIDELRAAVEFEIADLNSRAKWLSVYSTSAAAITLLARVHRLTSALAAVEPKGEGL